MRRFAPGHSPFSPVVLGCRRWKSTTASSLIPSPPLVYISGEEMTRWAGALYLNEWIKPYVDISQWEFYDLSCVSRDKTDDGVLRDCIAAGKRIGAIYKEPTITPTADQVKEFGLKKAWGSPNGAMRRGWNGISISRDTIHLPGMQLGYKKQCLFDRHAVGGEYGASFATVGKGTLKTTFTKPNGEVAVVNERTLGDDVSAVVVYDNPYDNVHKMAHHFFSRCLEAKVTPYIVTKKTVFKWQESFWSIMKKVFDANYKEKFQAAGLLKDSKGELCHFLSDVASMQVIRWTDGGWGMCAHNYDGDVLTDEIAQVHRSPGFLTSVLNGVKDDGTIIKEFEASHGTVTDMWKAHLRGEETSLNPLSMMEALIGSMVYAAKGEPRLTAFCKNLQTSIHQQMVTPGKGTRDLCGPSGLTTQQFVSAVRSRLDSLQAPSEKPAAAPSLAAPAFTPIDQRKVDRAKMRQMFDELDTDKNGSIDFEEFVVALKRLGIAPSRLETLP